MLSSRLALFPFAPGHQISRTHLTSDEVIIMGRFLGELHQVLHNYPQEHVPHRSFIVDYTATLATIETIEAAIHSQSSASNEDAQTLSRLAERRAWLTTAPFVEVKAISSLEQQVIHGYYQETNLFFEDGYISAVIDWDQSYVAPRAWEVVRTLQYVCKLQGPLCRMFLDAYRHILPLTSEDLETAAAVYGWIRAHDLWHYQAIYLEGNQRVRTFYSQDLLFLLRIAGLHFENFCTMANRKIEKTIAVFIVKRSELIDKATILVIVSPYKMP